MQNSTCIKYLGMQIIKKKKGRSSECENIIRINFHTKKILSILSKRYSSGATDSAQFIDFFFFIVTFQWSWFLLDWYTNIPFNYEGTSSHSRIHDRCFPRTIFLCLTFLLFCLYCQRHYSYLLKYYRKLSCHRKLDMNPRSSGQDDDKIEGNDIFLIIKKY